MKVIDACGAGDAFIAGFLMGYQKGWDLDAAGRLGNACGALCVTQVGTSEGISGLEEILDSMEPAQRIE